MNKTQVTIVGNLTADPELRFTPSGAAVANFTVAVTPRTYDRQTNEWVDGEATFYNCSVWREYAENVAESLAKGTQVVVIGSLSTRGYERRDGSPGMSVEISVDEVGPCLRWATANVSRVGRQGGQNRAQDSRGGGRGPSGQGRGQQRSQGRPGGGEDPWAEQQSQRSYDSRPDPWNSGGDRGRGGYDEEPPF